MICEAKNSKLPEWNSEIMTCVVDYSKSLMLAASRESCGKCVLCREGTYQVYKIFEDITLGNAKSEDLDLAKELLELIAENAGCDMSRQAAATSIRLMAENEDEWHLHIRRKRCTHLVCKASYTMYIDPTLCNGCGECLDVCEVKAISGAVGLIHVIDTSLCIKSNKCMFLCSQGAVKKAGPIKPNLPKAPVPVGSFGESSEEGIEDSGKRRRRRKS